MEVKRDKKLVEALAEVLPGLPFRSAVRKLFAGNWRKADLDVGMLERVRSPLSLASPHELALQTEACAGANDLLSPEAQAAIGTRLVALHADQILGQLAAAIASIMHSYRKGGLAVSLAVAARGLATISMSSFVSGHHCFRRDLAAILHCGPEDGATLLNRYRSAALSGDSQTLENVDRRITGDGIWGPWAKAFVTEGARLAEPPLPVTEWQLSASPMSAESIDNIRRWLFKGGR